MKKILIVIVFSLTVFLSSCNNKETTAELNLNIGIDTVDVGTTWIDAGAVAVLSTDEEVTYDIYTSDTVDTSTTGVVEVEYEYTVFLTDVTYSITRFVTVEDMSAPVIELNSSIDTVHINDTWTDTGVTYTDNSGLDCTTVVTGEVSTSTIGVYDIKYRVTDPSGNASIRVRTVTVIE